MVRKAGVKMLVLITMLGLTCATFGVAYYWYTAAVRESVLRRLDDSTEEAEAVNLEQPFAKRHLFLVWLLVIPVGVLLAFLTSWPTNLVAGLMIVLGCLLAEMDAWIYGWRVNRMESQLAEATDVIVASLSSGASLQASLQQASEFSPMPLRSELEEMVARLRLGDSPIDIFDSLRQRVPTETFQLLATTLTVNWSVGGELSGTLSSIATTIRDRLAIARQIRTLSTQGTVTTLTVLAVIWFMAAMMWQSDPMRFEGFLASATGSWLVAAGLLLQGLGVALVSRISRPKI